MTTKRNLIFRRLACAAVVTALAWSVPHVRAEDEKQPQLSEKVSEGLQKVKPLQDAKNYKAILEIIDNLLAGSGPTSYDRAFLLDAKAVTYAQLEQYNNAIAPWEEALQLAQQYHYFDERKRDDMMKFLAQLIYAEASSSKNKAEQARLITKSAHYLQMYLDQVKKPEPEVFLLYATVLYFQATADEHNVNQPMLAQAKAAVEKGMLGSIKPKEGLYRLLLVILQQQNDNVHSAEVMELLLSQYPNNKDLWSGLFGLYYNLAGSAKAESREQREYYIRAIDTIERAQKLGFMNTPRDNYNLFTLYVAAGEVDLATELLYSGLKSGKIESTPQNWRILGNFYQQQNKELQAISALQEATKIFPKDGSLEFTIGQNYQQLDDTKNAFKHYAAAVAKGNLGEKPHLPYLYLSWCAFELGDYETALKAVTDATKYPDGAKDPQVKNLKKGIEDAIAERELKKENDAKKAQGGAKNL